jgi:predicted RNase H-like HicB family nuclease
MSWRFGRSKGNLHGPIYRQGRRLDLEDCEMTLFVGVLDGSGDVWGVRIPDVPGCVGGGATAEVAIADVTSALRDVMTHKQSGGLALPVASSLASIIRSGEIAEGESTVMIPLLLD